MTRVLLINKLFYPVVGGVEATVAQIAMGVAADKDFTATILAGNEKRTFLNKVYQWHEVTVHKTASFGLVYNTALSFNYPIKMHSLLQSNDVLHFHVPNPLGEISFYLNSIPASKKVIVTAHADIAYTRKKAYTPMYNFFLKKLLDRADVITTMSPQNLAGFTVLQPYLPKCHIVPLAFDARHILPVTEQDKIAFRQKFGLHSNKKIALFTGRLSSDKGLSYLIEAIKKLPEVQLIIAGDGSLKNDLVASANKHTIFTGFISGIEMACAYSLADVFVLPSVSETFGLVQAEAMHFGVPVINTALNTGVNSVSIHNETGLTVPPANADALASAIGSIVHNKDLWARFSVNALQRSYLFAPEKMVQAFKKFYL